MALNLPSRRDDGGVRGGTPIITGARMVIRPHGPVILTEVSRLPPMPLPTLHLKLHVKLHLKLHPKPRLTLLRRRDAIHPTRPR